MILSDFQGISSIFNGFHRIWRAGGYQKYTKTNDFYSPGPRKKLSKKNYDASGSPNHRKSNVWACPGRQIIASVRFRRLWSPNHSERKVWVLHVRQITASVTFERFRVLKS